MQHARGAAVLLHIGMYVLFDLVFGRPGPT